MMPPTFWSWKSKLGVLKSLRVKSIWVAEWELEALSSDSLIIGYQKLHFFRMDSIGSIFLRFWSWVSIFHTRTRLGLYVRLSTTLFARQGLKRVPSSLMWTNRYSRFKPISPLFPISWTCSNAPSRSLNTPHMSPVDFPGLNFNENSVVLGVWGNYESIEWLRSFIMALETSQDGEGYWIRVEFPRSG